MQFLRRMLQCWLVLLPIKGNDGAEKGIDFWPLRLDVLLDYRSLDGFPYRSFGWVIQPAESKALLPSLPVHLLAESDLPDEPLRPSNPGDATLLVA